jgi:tetratricopeptide (TPR) repeat protein
VVQLFQRFQITAPETIPLSDIQEKVKEESKSQQENSQKKASVRSRTRALKKEIKKRPSYPELYYQLYSIYSDTRDTKRAIKTLEDLISVRADEIKAHFLLGKLYYKEKKYEEAESRFGRAFSLSPNDDINSQIIEIKAYLILSSYLKGDKKQAEMHASGWEETILQNLEDLSIEREDKDKLIMILKFI